MMCKCSRDRLLQIHCLALEMDRDLPSFQNFQNAGLSTYVWRRLGLGTICGQAVYTRSPLQDSRLFGPSPWKILATTYEQKDF